MPRGRKVFDTSTLIAHWNRSKSAALARDTDADAVEWARKLIGVHRTDAVVTPVHIEFLAGVQSQHELRLARVYLGQFRILDKGEILTEDWEMARRIAERVPRDRSKRHLGDCLIRALARRLNCEVVTVEKHFPA